MAADLESQRSPSGLGDCRMRRRKAALVRPAQMPALPISEIKRCASTPGCCNPAVRHGVAGDAGGTSWARPARTAPNRPTMVSTSASLSNSTDEGAVPGSFSSASRLRPARSRWIGCDRGRLRLDRPSATADPGFFPPAAAPPLHREAKKPRPAALHCVAAPKDHPIAQAQWGPGGCEGDRPRS